MAFLLALPVAATAAALNQTSDRAALSAYATYLQAIVNGAKQGQKADSAFVAAHSRASCVGALAGAVNFNKTSSTKRSVAAFKDLGAEIEGDIDLKFLTETHAPFHKLASKLDALSWSSKSIKTTVTSFVKALHAVLQLRASNPCADALDLSSKPTAEPAGTKAFLKSYLGDSNTFQERKHALETLLARYETPADSGVVSRIDSLADTFSTVSGDDEQKSFDALTKALEKS